MTKQYLPLDIANAFISKYGQSGGIQHMKLQKLVYYAYGWWLAYNDKPLLLEGPEVWQYGPVFDSLYRSLAQFGKLPITQPQKPLPFTTVQNIDDQIVINLIDWIWNKYGPYSAIQLSNETHAEGTPWLTVAKEHGFKVSKNLKIPDDLIKSYFIQEKAKLEGWLNG